MKYKIQKYLNKNKSIFIYSMLLTAMITSLFSAKENFNFWNNIYENLSNNTSNIIIILLTIYITIDYSKYNTNINILLRENNFKTHIKNNIKEIIYLLIYTLIQYYLIVLSGAILISYGMFDIPNNIITILIAKLITNTILTIEISLLFSLITCINKKAGIITSLIMLIESMIENNKLIEHFYQIPINPISNLNNIIYKSTYLQIISSLLYILLITCIIKILIDIYTNKKRDIK